MSTPVTGCDHCNKSCLSLLLLRPSPIALRSPLAPLLGATIQTHPALLQGIVPSAALQETRYALRLLRAGFVHVYIPSPPPGVKQWQVYRVAANGDLISSGNATFKQRPEPPPCNLKHHNVTGMKLLPIPQAHHIKTLWIAYSANLWNPKLREQNAANPHVMQQIDLDWQPQNGPGKPTGSPIPNTFEPTADNLTKYVLECGLHRYCVGNSASTDHDYPFHALHKQVDALAQTLERAAAQHPKTKGKALAVVLRDPVGAATEFNALRLKWYDQFEQYNNSGPVERPLKVNRIIQMLRNDTISKAEEEALNHVAPLRTKEAYLQSTELPAGTKWQALTDEERKINRERFEQGNWLGKVLAGPALEALSAPNIGRIIYPDFEQRADAWARQAAVKTWNEMLPYYNEAARKQWEEAYHTLIGERYIKPLEHFEHDWNTVLADPAILNYFKFHFDETEPHDLAYVGSKSVCHGTVYCKEVHSAYTPEPFTDVALDTFTKQIDAEIQAPEAVMQRALTANQANLWDTLTGAENKRSNTYDFMKGLIGEFLELKGVSPTHPLPARVGKRVSWLTDAFMGFSLNIQGSLASVAMRHVNHYWRNRTLKTPPAPDPKILSRLQRAQQMALLHRACEEALQAKGGYAKIPVLVMAHMDLDTLVQLKRARGEMLSIREIRKLSRQGRITVGLLTDSSIMHELKTSPDVVARELTAKADAVLIQEQALLLKTHVANQAGSSAMLTIPIKRFADLLEQHLKESAQAPALFKAMLLDAARKGVDTVQTHTGVQKTTQAARSFEGRLAIGAMMIQGLGVWIGMQSYYNAKAGDPKLPDYALSVANSVAGFLGGGAEFAAAWSQAHIEVTRGVAAIEKSARLPFLRGFAQGMGFIGNVTLAWMCFREAARLKKDGNIHQSKMMIYAMVTLSIGAIPMALMTAHLVLQALVLRGTISAGGVVVTQVSRMALYRVIIARLGGSAIGLSVPGLGWAFTAVGVGFMVYAIVTEPTPLQTWLKGCYFGKPDGDAPTRHSWADEEKAWKELQKKHEN
ncbi:T6SS effector BTH_I2691 family protein [Chitinivorax sp. B]|uniref:T6SS effector BTH_I2691 family protein n=1 Tax=Chitinivorax sp. B TaxID=2502235 RepID=UPI0010F4D1D4|nr:T6SS effector BTH_I2691 family protein [Chitinivorax sp. B]